jgi:hypothetical protein
MKYLKSAAVGLVVLAALAPAGGVRAADKDVDSDALDLNEAIQEANRKINVAGRAFGETLAPALKEKDVDLRDLRRDYKYLQKVVAQVQADMKDVTVPKTEVARAYAKAHQQYLKAQEGFVKREFAEILTVMEDETLSAADKKKKTLAISKKVNTADQKVFTALVKAQKAFAKEYGIKIK